MKTRLMLKVEGEIGEELHSYIKREYSGKYRTLMDVSSSLSVPRSTLKLFMMRLGLPIRKSFDTLKKGNFRKPSPQELNKIYMVDRAPMEVMCQKYRVSRATIYKWAKSYGLIIKDSPVRWSNRHRHCRNCLGQDSRHIGKGYCERCYPYCSQGREKVKRVISL